MTYYFSRFDNGPYGVAVTPDGSLVYVANFLSSTVSVIDTATNSVSTVTDPSFSAPQAFGIFIQQPALLFAGAPGHSNCNGNTVSASEKEKLTKQVLTTQILKACRKPVYTHSDVGALLN